MIKEIIEKYPNEEIIIFDNFNEAIIGFDEKKMKVVYSVDKCIEQLQKDGLNYKEAKEFFYYNTYDTYIGEKTPIFKNDIN
jgi:hypothetical protein